MHKLLSAAITISACAIVFGTGGSSVVIHPAWWFTTSQIIGIMGTIYALWAFYPPE